MAQLRIDKIPSNNSSAGVDPWEDDEDTINDVESLKKGIIQTSKNNTKAPYTIVLLGETGVGKSSVVELIANVLAGNDIDNCNLTMLDHANEQRGSDNQSQTNSARLYELKSKNGIVVRILDTPGLADTRGIRQDELHKKSIETQIKDHIDSLTAVLVLADGAVPRVTVGTNYALSTLSPAFPNTLVNNIAFMFTNVSSPLHWNFSEETVPDVLGNAPRFLLNNPIALQRKYLKLVNDPKMKRKRTDFRRAAKAAEPAALGALVDVFDWLDGLEPQSTKEITSLYEKARANDTETTNILARMGQAATKKAKINKQTQSRQYSADMWALSNFETTVNNPVWKLRHAPSRNYVCTAPNCYSTCSYIHLFTPFQRLLQRRCGECGHPHRSHSHTHRQWASESNPRRSLDEDRKKTWEAAKDEKENTEALIDDLGRATDEAVEHLALITEDYIGRPLPGSLSTHVETTIRFLEERYTDMAKKNVSEEQLRKTQGDLSLMRRKLVLLRSAEEKAQRGV